MPISLKLSQALWESGEGMRVGGAKERNRMKKLKKKRKAAATAVAMEDEEKRCENKVPVDG